MSRQVDSPVPKNEPPVGDSPDTLHRVCADESVADESVADESATIVAEFLRTAHLMRCLLSAHFAPFGLTDTWFFVLEFLNRSMPGGCSQAELAVEIGQSESSVSTLIERMRSHGLLHRLRSKADRRKHLLVVTERGQATYTSVQQYHNQRTAQLLSGLRADEWEAFSGLLNRLGTELARIKSSRDAAPKPSREMTRPDDHRKDHRNDRQNDRQKPAA